MNFDINIHRSLAALLISSVWLLSGCSGEPSNADIENALAVNAARDTSQMEQLSRGSSQALILQMHAARKLGCKPDTAAAYVCNVELVLPPPRGVRTRTNASLPLVQGPEGWSISRSK